jgi:hypothetical protein
VLVDSAILKDGIIHRGRRHHLILHDPSYPQGYMKGGTQGFVTDTGVFLDRVRALEHAKVCGQFRGKLIGSVLTSEDLW